MLEISLFSLLALCMVLGSFVMIMSKQPVFSAFGFLVAMIGMAGIFALLNNQFLAIAQIMVSVGAVVVLSILTILTVNAKEESLPKEPHKIKWIILTSVLIAPFTILLYKALCTLPDHFSTMGTINSKVLGKALFTDWVLPFEILSILLLSAMLSAIVIARKSKRKKEENHESR